MKEETLNTVKQEIRETLEKLKKQHCLNCKDEIRILQMLTEDVAKQLVGRVTITSNVNSPNKQ